MIDGQVISRFTITQLLFWNGGEIPIRPTDFIKSRSLSIRIPRSARVFEIRIIKSTNPDVAAQIKAEAGIADPSFSYYPIEFECLDKNDGFSAIVIHDGGDGDVVDFSGKLPGVKQFHGINRHLRGSMSERINPSIPNNYTPPLLKWVVAPVIFLALGFIGALTIYQSIFEGFHWYQPFGWWMITYYFAPFFVFTGHEPEIPPSLYSALISEETAKTEGGA